VTQSQEAKAPFGVGGGAGQIVNSELGAKKKPHDHRKCQAGQSQPGEPGRDWGVGLGEGRIGHSGEKKGMCVGTQKRKMEISSRVGPGGKNMLGRCKKTDCQKTSGQEPL